MTTNILSRYAEDISCVNDIANFDTRYSIKGINISAVSWEIKGKTRKEGSEELLKLMIKKALPTDRLEEIKLKVIVELSAVQPNSAIVNYKKTWGLLKERGVHTEYISDKTDYIKKVNNGITLSGAGVIGFSQEGMINNLINTEINVYFSINKNSKKIIDYGKERFNWMNETWKDGGVIFFALGLFDEPSCEVVAMGHKKDLQYLTEL